MGSPKQAKHSTTCAANFPLVFGSARTRATLACKARLHSVARPKAVIKAFEHMACHKGFKRKRKKKEERRKEGGPLRLLLLSRLPSGWPTPLATSRKALLPSCQHDGFSSVECHYALCRHPHFFVMRKHQSNENVCHTIIQIQRPSRCKSITSHIDQTDLIAIACCSKSKQRSEPRTSPRHQGLLQNHLSTGRKIRSCICACIRQAEALEIL